MGTFKTLLISSLLATATTAQALPSVRTLLASSGTGHVELLELYTSEGCSSCPPADQWISGLKDQGDLWKSYVPVVFHVDYWNNSSWKDELSSPSMTERQAEIVKLWSHPSVYTPGVVLDGKEWQSWREVRNPPGSSSHLGKIKLDIFRETDGSITVKVEKPKNDRHYIIRLAQLGMGLSSNVTGGENSGRTLKHNFAVLSWSGKNLGTDQSEENFKLKSTDQKVSQTAVAAWIEEAGNPTPLQAAGGYL